MLLPAPVAGSSFQCASSTCCVLLLIVVERARGGAPNPDVLIFHIRHEYRHKDDEQVGGQGAALPDPGVLLVGLGGAKGVAYNQGGFCVDRINNLEIVFRAANSTEGGAKALPGELVESLLPVEEQQV